MYISFINHFRPEANGIILMSQLTGSQTRGIFPVKSHHIASCRSEILQTVGRSFKKSKLIIYTLNELFNYHRNMKYTKVVYSAWQQVDFNLPVASDSRLAEIK